MKLTKNYNLLNFLNRKHSLLFRVFIGVSSWFFVIIVTLKPRLAKRAFQNILSDNFRLGMRQMHWYSKRSWLKFSPIDDRFFDFTDGLSQSELADQASFLGDVSAARSTIGKKIDGLYILASKAHLALENNQQENYSKISSQYLELVNNILRLLENSDLEKGQSSATKTHENVFSKQDATLALNDFAKQFSNSDLPWFIGSGTFLGTVREGDWLNHDLDIDLGVNFEDINISDTIEILRKSSSFSVQKLVHQITIEKNSAGQPALKKRPTLIKLIHSTGINVDVFIHFVEGDIRWHGSIVHRWDNKPFELAPYDLAGISVLGPKDSDLYLKENYGNWRVPVVDYNCTTGPPNLSIVKNLTSIALFLRRAAFHLEKGEKEQAKLTMSKLEKAKIFVKKNSAYAMQPGFFGGN